jgi:BirA family biotin operon repressor/biotin-[acetyl-CoA-carboxylase] ligase
MAERVLALGPLAVRLSKAALNASMQMPLAAGLAVAEAVGELGVDTALKWPNDVLASGGKLAGILSEAASGRAGTEWVVLGIGVNVAADTDDVPPGIRESVTSLAAEGGDGVTVPGVAASVLAACLPTP